MSSNQLKYEIAARLNSTSIRPNVPSANSTSARQSAGSVRLAGLHGDHLSAGAAHVSTVDSAGSTATSQPTTDAPSRANAIAAARPMLPPVPVMTQTFPESLPDMG